MSFGSAGSGKVGDWSYLWTEIKRRTTQPFSDVPFVIYVLVGIVGLGCLGIWVEVVKTFLSPSFVGGDGVLTALATFFPALICSSSLQLILASTGRGDKVLVSIGYFVSFVAVIAAVLISVLNSRMPHYTVWAAVAFSVLAIWLWWFTNGDDPTYKSAPVDAATGGNPTRALKGDTTGFQE